MHCPECNSPVKFNRCDKCNITVSSDKPSQGAVYGCGANAAMLEATIRYAMHNNDWKEKYQRILEENNIPVEDIEQEVKRRNLLVDNRQERGFDDYKNENL